ncbi:MAG TPA: O-antigen polymerase, partial [Segetibacter sp.]
MNNYEFYDLLLANLNLYLLLTVIIFGVYYLLFRKKISTIIDPLFLPVLYSAIGTVTVLLLFVTKHITTTAFTSYCCTQVAYYAGFFLLGKHQRKNEEYTISEISPAFIRQIKLAFAYFSVILVFFQLLVYAQKGIPLFQFSRLDTYTGGSGFGIYSRFIEVSTIAVIYLYLVLFFNNKSNQFRWTYHLMLFVTLIFLFLSGSKSALLIIPYVLFAFLRLHQNSLTVMKHPFTIHLKKRIFYVAVLAIALVLIVIKVQGVITDGLSNPLVALVLRFVHSGDTFWYAYPWNMYAKIEDSRPFLALFNDFLGFFRIYNWTALPESLGFTLIKLQHSLDGNYGPNARQNVFGLVYFGYYGSIIFSFILGIIFHFIRNVLQRFCNSNFLTGIFFSILFINAASLE